MFIKIVQLLSRQGDPARFEIKLHAPAVESLILSPWTIQVRFPLGQLSERGSVISVSELDAALGKIVVDPTFQTVGQDQWLQAPAV